MATDLKQQLRQLLAADRPEAALPLLLTAAEANALPELHREALLQSAQLEYWRRQSRAGTEDYADLARTRNRLNLALLDLTDALPEGLPAPEPTAAAAAQGLDEHTFKNRLMWAVIIAKVVVLVFVFTLWESGAFTAEQFAATAGLLAPVFAAYLGVMYKDYVGRRHVGTAAADGPRVTRGFARTAYLLTGAYALALLLVLNLRGPGHISFGEMNGLLALVESALGVYLGQLVAELYKPSQ